MARRRSAPESTTPQVRLSSAIKTARDIMRKDAGLNGDLDRIPQLAWLLFLRAFDALEQRREVTDRGWKPAIEAPHRWRDWAPSPPDGRTGRELLDFVNGRLLPYLRELSGEGAGDSRDTLKAVFGETYNRMLSGYLLRDVIDQVAKIDFASSEDIHTMAHLYESMLREVRDAAGDSGEFYTPRPVIRFMVQQVAPRLGETVFDPACGTGGFLVEALEEMAPSAETAEGRRALEASLRGTEKKPLPYLLAMMNLALHGVEQPAIVRDNALSRPVTQIREADRVDVVLTNPPFGGEEEKSIQANFPDATRTGETALLFIQLVQRTLKSGGRCGVVVPNGFLFGDGVAARVKERLLAECNLHTVVRLPDGVFAPYTDIPSNLLFFEKTGPTREVWFYEIAPPEGRRKYSKTRPLRIEELKDCQGWWGGAQREGRVENERAWRVSVGEIENDRRFDLDRKNPSRANDLAHLPPADLVAQLVTTERRIMALLEAIHEAQTADRSSLTPLGRWITTPLHELLKPTVDGVTVDRLSEYPNIGVLNFGRGLFEKPPIDGGRTSARTLNRVRAGQFIYSRLSAFEGAYALVPERFDGFYVSNEFPTFDIATDRVDPRFLLGYFQSPETWNQLAVSSKGLGVRRQRVQPEALLAHAILLPSLPEQQRLAGVLDIVARVEEHRQEQAPAFAALRASILNRAFAGLKG